jgi:hypothetical protein
MKLWFIRPVDEDSSPWRPWWDKAFAMVIRAETENEARDLATKANYCEVEACADVWTNPKWSSCVELTGDGERGVVLADVRWA